MHFACILQKFENAKLSLFLKTVLKVGIVYSLDAMGVEYFDEIALSVTVKEINH